jgi:hypothetical protein
MPLKKPTVLQAFLIALSGAALAFFSCIGVLSQTNFGTGVTAPAGNVLVFVFLAGMAIFLAAAVILGIYTVKAIWDALTRQRPPERPRGV